MELPNLLYPTHHYIIFLDTFYTSDKAQSFFRYENVFICLRQVMETKNKMVQYQERTQKSSNK